LAINHISQVVGDQAIDELSQYDQGVVPKVLVTTSHKPVGVSSKMQAYAANILA
jgi:hypothetical protein